MKMKKKINDEEEEVIMIRRVAKTGMLYFPKFLIGKEIEIRFKRKLTEEDKHKLRINQLKSELKEMRMKRLKEKEK